MNENQSRGAFLTWCGCMLLAGLLRFGPATLPATLRSAYQDASGVALSLGSWRGSEAAVHDNSSMPATDTANDASLTVVAENRALAAQVADLQEQLKIHQQATRVNWPSVPPLQEYSQLRARVLGWKGERSMQSGRLLIALGRRHGLLEEELCLSGNGVLIDVGTDSGTAADQLAVQGSVLVGRIARVGTWTALVQPVTDPDFRVGVRLVRESRVGPVYGPRGILAGDGATCQLLEVPATEAVSVGDDVYLESSELGPHVHLYCGTVTHADVQEHATQWTITVEPGMTPAELPETLQVLHTRLNEQRLASGEQGHGL